MTAEQLRNSILQEAISGRLVPQDPNDEPASVLLQRIREEKARLVKEGKLKKKDLVETPITEEEIPFEIPASWEWVRLGYLVDFSKSSSVKASSISPNAWILDLEDIQKNTGVLLRKKRMGETVSISDKHQFKKGNVLYSKLRPYLNKVIVADEDGYCTSEILCFNFGEINNHYAQLFLMSAFFVDYAMKDAYGVKMPRLGSKQGNNALFPLPPLAEQKRIVAKLEELLPIVEQYGKAQKELDELNAALPARLRQSILQEAISGRLVPQDENEAADGLKEHLLQAVNNSPFKKKWNSEPIEEDELPFDIHKNWKWIRLGDILYTQTGLSYSKGDLEKKVSNPIRVLRGGNIQSGSWCTKDDDVMIAPEFVKKDIFLKKNSFITPAVTSLEHLGKTALIREDHNDIVAGGFVLYLMPYDDRNDGLMEYLAYFFQSAFYNSFCKTITNKSGQAFWNISREKLLKLPIPLPPLAEQKRIVAKIEELFAEIDKLK